MRGGENMANGLAAAGCGAPTAVSPFMDMCKNNGFLLLLLLFVLLASCTTMGREKNFIFIIILAIIAFGGFGRTFGFGGPTAY
jgi:hypothetical protein